jgi:hypothetical protein
MRVQRKSLKLDSSLHLFHSCLLGGEWQVQAIFPSTARRTTQSLGSFTLAQSPGHSRVPSSQEGPEVGEFPVPSNNIYERPAGEVAASVRASHRHKLGIAAVDTRDSANSGASAGTTSQRSQVTAPQQGSTPLYTLPPELAASPPLQPPRASQHGSARQNADLHVFEATGPSSETSVTDIVRPSNDLAQTSTARRRQRQRQQQRCRGDRHGHGNALMATTTTAYTSDAASAKRIEHMRGARASRRRWRAGGNPSSRLVDGPVELVEGLAAALTPEGARSAGRSVKEDMLNGCEKGAAEDALAAALCGTGEPEDGNCGQGRGSAGASCDSEEVGGRTEGGARLQGPNSMFGAAGTGEAALCKDSQPPFLGHKPPGRGDVQTPRANTARNAAKHRGGRGESVDVVVGGVPQQSTQKRTPVTLGRTLAVDGGGCVGLDGDKGKEHELAGPFEGDAVTDVKYWGSRNEKGKQSEGVEMSQATTTRSDEVRRAREQKGMQSTRARVSQTIGGIQKEGQQAKEQEGVQGQKVWATPSAADMDEQSKRPSAQRDKANKRVGVLQEIANTGMGQEFEDACEKEDERAGVMQEEGAVARGGNRKAVERGEMEEVPPLLRAFASLAALRRMGQPETLRWHKFMMTPRWIVVTRRRGEGWRHRWQERVRAEFGDEIYGFDEAAGEEEDNLARALMDSMRNAGESCEYPQDQSFSDMGERSIIDLHEAHDGTFSVSDSGDPIPALCLDVDGTDQASGQFVAVPTMPSSAEAVATAMAALAKALAGGEASGDQGSDISLSERMHGTSEPAPCSSAGGTCHPPERVQLNVTPTTRQRMAPNDEAAGSIEASRTLAASTAPVEEREGSRVGSREDEGELAALEPAAPGSGEVSVRFGQHDSATRGEGKHMHAAEGGHGAEGLVRRRGWNNDGEMQEGPSWLLQRAVIGKCREDNVDPMHDVRQVGTVRGHGMGASEEGISWHGHSSRVDRPKGRMTTVDNRRSGAAANSGETPASAALRGSHNEGRRRAKRFNSVAARRERSSDRQHIAKVKSQKLEAWAAAVEAEQLGQA